MTTPHPANPHRRNCRLYMVVISVATVSPKGLGFQLVSGLKETWAFGKNTQRGLSRKQVFIKDLAVLIYNDGLPRPNLGQLCATLCDSQSQLDVIQPGFEPGTVVTPLAMRCSALDLCATREMCSSLPRS